MRPAERYNQTYCRFPGPPYTSNAMCTDNVQRNYSNAIFLKLLECCNACNNSHIQRKKWDKLDGWKGSNKHQVQLNLINLHQVYSVSEMSSSRHTFHVCQKSSFALLLFIEMIMILISLNNQSSLCTKMQSIR